MKKGFTLAEVLITLGIIGVVASMTIPTLITNNQQRSLDTAANIFNRKLGEALKVMNSQSSLAGHSSTRAFIDELSNHIKIIKICNSNELDICFASEFSTNDSTYKVNELKQAKNLNKDGNYNTETIGVVFADGVSALIAYNPRATQDPYSNQIVGITSSDHNNSKNIGLSTDAISILYDVSGKANPNIYGTGGDSQLKDIRGLNISINTGADILILWTNYTSINCSSLNSTPDDVQYCLKIGTSPDYWSGANKACKLLGMRLPTFTELSALYNDDAWADKPTSGTFWSSSSESNIMNAAYTFIFDNPDSVGVSMVHTPQNALCVSD